MKTISRHSKPHILIISDSYISGDGRVLRHIQALNNEYRITTMGRGERGKEGTEHLEFSKRKRQIPGSYLKQGCLRIARRFDHMYREIYEFTIPLEQAGRTRFDAVLANDVQMLPIAFELARGAPVIADAHEFSPAQRAQNPLWRAFISPLYDYICREYLPRVAHMFTVSPGIAQLYRVRYGVTAEVLTNAPRYHKLAPTKTDASRVRLIHHGAAMPGRGLESLIDMTGYLDDRFRLDLMLVPSNSHSEYYQRLSSQVDAAPRVRMVDPVPPDRVISTLHESYDIGVYLLPSSSLNHRFALPNKFFDFVQARLAVAVGPAEGMAAVVREHGTGVVAHRNDPAELAKLLNSLTPAQIQQYKERSSGAAYELSAECNRHRLRETLEATVGYQS